MTQLAGQGFAEAGGHRLEYRHWGPQPSAAPTIVLLHEGLGCAGLWGDFPQRIVDATGCGVLAYSRAGYGASSPVPLPRPLTYMHDEARKVLTALFDALDLQHVLLVGHSDGASIAAVYAGAFADARLAGVTLIAPHFVVEDISLASIAEARVAYETTDLRARLARYHDNVDVAFYGWNGAWLDPAFRDWNIAGYLEHMRVPLQIIQGAEDQYGTLQQIAVAKARCAHPPEVLILPGVRHTPQREAPDVTVAAIASFASRALGTQTMLEKGLAR